MGLRSAEEIEAALYALTRLIDDHRDHFEASKTITLTMREYADRLRDVIKWTLSHPSDFDVLISDCTDAVSTLDALECLAAARGEQVRTD